MKKPILIIITGLSGAGKTSALKVLEDMGFFSIDNLPPPLVPEFLELLHSSKRAYDRAAIVVDVRAREFFGEVVETVSRAREIFRVLVLFLEASDEALINRFKVSRRPHPLGASITLEDAVRKERKLLIPLRDMADFVLDTTQMNVHELRDALKKIFNECREEKFHLHLISFSFSSGIPAESHLVFDVRFMPNPFFSRDLKGKSGIDAEVKKFLYKSPVVMEFLDRTKELIDFLIPLYINEGKTYLVISFGCTGGVHRSVFAVEHFYDVYSKSKNLVVKKIHRELS